MVTKIADSAERRALAAETNLVIGEILLNSKPRKALAYLRQAQFYYLKMPDNFDLPRVYLAQYNAYNSLADLPRANRALDKGIRWHEAQRLALADPDWRQSYSERMDETFKAVISRELDGRRLLSALRYSERQKVIETSAFGSRSSSQIRIQQTSVLSEGKIRTALPRGMHLVVYVVLSRRCAVWRFGQEGSRFFELPESSSTLTPLIVSYYKTLNDQRAYAIRQRLLSQMYSRILAPVISGIHPNDTIVFVPSGVLTRIPFSAALNGRTGRYLMQDFRVAVSPSALWLLDQLNEVKGWQGEDNLGVIALGAPNIDRRVFADLVNLPLAAIEAQRVRSSYTRGSLFLGATATKARLAEGLSRFSIVHIGAHAVSNDRFPGRSVIVLSSSGLGDDGLLYPRDIVGLDLSGVRLVVLGVCDGRSVSSVGSLSLVTPFLAAGAKSVIASLWNVEDSLGLRLLPLVHKAIAGKESPSAALRAAQLQLVADSDPSLRDPRGWGSFEAFGL
jgi:CHAT domain-containing protein